MSEHVDEGSQPTQPEEPVVESPEVAEVESILSQSQDEDDAQGGSVTRRLRQPYVVGGVSTTIVLPASFLAIRWLRRRRPSPPLASPAGMAERLAISRLGGMLLQRVGSPRRTRQPRLAALTRQARMQMRKLGDQARMKAGQTPQSQQVSTWQAAGGQVQQYRMTLAALVVAFGVLGVGRWLDQQARRREEN